MYIPLSKKTDYCYKIRELRTPQDVAKYFHKLKYSLSSRGKFIHPFMEFRPEGGAIEIWQHSYDDEGRCYDFFPVFPFGEATTTTATNDMAQYCALALKDYWEGTYISMERNIALFNKNLAESISAALLFAISTIPGPFRLQTALLSRTWFLQDMNQYQDWMKAHESDLSEAHRNSIYEFLGRINEGGRATSQDVDLFIEVCRSSSDRQEEKEKIMQIFSQKYPLGNWGMEKRS